LDKNLVPKLRMSGVPPTPYAFMTWTETTLRVENGIILIFLGWCLHALLKLFCFFWKCQNQCRYKWT